MTAFLMLQQLLPRLARPAVIALVLAVLGFTTVQWFQLRSAQHELADTQLKLNACRSTIDAYTAISEQQKAETVVREQAVKFVGKRAVEAVKELKAEPVTNTLGAIETRGKATAKKASDLWNE